MQKVYNISLAHCKEARAHCKERCGSQCTPIPILFIQLHNLYTIMCEYMSIGVLPVLIATTSRLYALLICLDTVAESLL